VLFRCAIDQILNHPDGEKDGGGGGGKPAVDPNDPTAPIIAMGFSAAEARDALSRYGDANEAIIHLLAAAEARAAEEAKKAEEKKKEDEKKAKEQRVKEMEIKRMARTRVMCTLFKQVCQYKPDAKTDDKDRTVRTAQHSTALGTHSRDACRD
jgi:hypothetical protein